MSIKVYGNSPVSRRNNNLPPEGPMTVHTNMIMQKEVGDTTINIPSPFTINGDTYSLPGSTFTVVSLDDFATPTKMSQVRSVDVTALFIPTDQGKYDSFSIFCPDSGDNYVFAPSLPGLAENLDVTNAAKFVKQSAIVTASINITTSLRWMNFYYMPATYNNISTDASRINVSMNLNNYDVVPIFNSAYWGFSPL